MVSLGEDVGCGFLVVFFGLRLGLGLEFLGGFWFKL